MRILVILGALSACATMPPDSYYADQHDAILDKHAIHPTCPPPAEHPTMKCGLYMLEWESHVAQEIESVACAGMKRDQCDAILADALLANLEKRYPHANWKAADLERKADPVKYRGQAGFEMALLESHNTRVTDYADKAVGAERESDAEEVESRNNRMAAAIRENYGNRTSYGEEYLKRQPTKCVSKKVFGQIETTCDR